MMMYSSRTKFRLDDTSDVGRNLFSTSQCGRRFDRIGDLPLPDAQRHGGHSKGCADKGMSINPIQGGETLTLVDQFQ